MQYIHELGQHLKIKVMKELADYKAKDNFWKNRFIWTQVEETDALSWWKGICSSTNLHKLHLLFYQLHARQQPLNSLKEQEN